MRLRTHQQISRLEARRSLIIELLLSERCLRPFWRSIICSGSRSNRARARIIRPCPSDSTFMSAAKDEETSISDTDSESEDTSTAATNSVTLQRTSRAASEDARNKLSMLIDSDDEDEEEVKKPKQQVLIKKRKVNSSLLSTNMAENTPTFSPSKADVIAKKKPKTSSSVQPDASKSVSVPVKEPTEIKRMTSRLGDTEWMEAELGEERLAAVSKAIDKIFEMSLDSDNFRLFGNDMIQCFYDVGTGTDIIFS